MASTELGHRRPKSSVLQSLVLPKTRNRMSKDVTHEQALGVRNANVQATPIFPSDHPHSKHAGTENANPQQSNDQGTPRRSRADKDGTSHKRSKSAVSIRSLVGGSRSAKDDGAKSRDASPEKKQKSPKKQVKKNKSSTGLASIFSKNKSSKDLSKPEGQQSWSDSQQSPAEAVQTPIWAQFATQQDDPSEHDTPKQIRVRDDVSDDKLRYVVQEMDKYTPKEYNPYAVRDFNGVKPTLSRPGSSYRPQSAANERSATTIADLPGAAQYAQRSHLDSRGSDSSANSHRIDRNTRPQSISGELTHQRRECSAEQRQTQAIAVPKRGSKVAAAVAAIDIKSQSPRKPDLPVLDAKVVEEAFEAVLERRNIPQDQRRSMRSLTLHVKADFVKQDGKASAPSSPVKQAAREVPSTALISSSAGEEKQQSPKKDEVGKTKSPSKGERPRSRTFNFTKSDSSPSKRSKSSSRPTSITDVKQVGGTPSEVSLADNMSSGSLVRSTTRPVSPSEYVVYLRAMVDPTQAEVGRVHKLRILLRNETVDWVYSFVELGGLTELIALLHRIMAIEWREDHEDQLMHESLLCLKGISTTNVALGKLAEVAPTLFPPLLHLIFDDEKKGPSEYTTRGIIISVLFAHLSAASSSSPAALAARVSQVLSLLEDPSKAESEPLPFVAEMHSRRPYRIWLREIANVTKEVFWIFLHHSNIVALPSSAAHLDDGPASFPVGPNPLTRSATRLDVQSSFTTRHFPGTRPPVPAAPYIGGVEWDATTYLTAHLDLLNGLIASLPDKMARNALRTDLRSSGFEKIMGGTLRTCKEKFYAGVHDALRTWVAAAVEDGWSVEAVRTGREEISESENGGRGSAAAATGGSPRKLSREEKEKIVLPELKLGTGIGKQKDGGKEDLDGWLA